MPANVPKFILGEALAYKSPFRYGRFHVFRNIVYKASLKMYMKTQLSVSMLKERFQSQIAKTFSEILNIFLSTVFDNIFLAFCFVHVFTSVSSFSI